jgi:hypothetical protein
MTKFSLNQLVKFNRNSQVKSDSTKVCAIVELPTEIATGLEQTYIIEHDKGWLPNSTRITKFELEATKKYLFVSEKELTAI